MGARSLATILAAQGESGFHPRLAPVHSRLVVPVTAADVMAVQTCPTLKYWPIGRAALHPPFSVLIKGETPDKSTRLLVLT